MKELKREDIEKDYFISRMIVGDCPNCGSHNTHDCEARSPIVNDYNLGSDCEVAKKLDDVCVGHCDDCGYLWCLECGRELSLENPVCICFIEDKR